MTLFRIILESDYGQPIEEIAECLRALDVDDLRVVHNKPDPSQVMAYDKSVDGLDILIAIAPPLVQSMCETLKAFFNRPRPEEPKTVIRIRVEGTDIDVSFPSTASTETVLREAGKLVRAARSPTRT